MIRTFITNSPMPMYNRRGLFGSAIKTLPQLKVDSGRKTMFEFDYYLKRIEWKTLNTDKMPCDEERPYPDTTRQG